MSSGGSNVAQLLSSSSQNDASSNAGRSNYIGAPGGLEHESSNSSLSSSTDSASVTTVVKSDAAATPATESLPVISGNPSGINLAQVPNLSGKPSADQKQDDKGSQADEKSSVLLANVCTQLNDGCGFFREHFIMDSHTVWRRHDGWRVDKESLVNTIRFSVYDATQWVPLFRAVGMHVQKVELSKEQLARNQELQQRFKGYNDERNQSFARASVQVAYQISVTGEQRIQHLEESLRACRFCIGSWFPAYLPKKNFMLVMRAEINLAEWNNKGFEPLRELLNKLDSKDADVDYLYEQAINQLMVLQKQPQLVVMCDAFLAAAKVFDSELHKKLEQAQSSRSSCVIC